MSRLRRRWIVARPLGLALHGSFWVLGAIFMLVLAAFGSGDRWIGLVMAIVCGLFVSALFARGAVSISQVGIRGGFPWMRRVEWNRLRQVDYSPSSALLLAGKDDNTSCTLALVPGYLWESEDRFRRAKQDFLRRIEEASEEFGWLPSIPPTEASM